MQSLQTQTSIPVQLSSGDGTKSVKYYEKENFNVNYRMLFSKNEADELFHQLESNVDYYSGDLARIKMFGKWVNIPRQHVAYGSNGLHYKFSGNTIPAKPWSSVPCLQQIKDRVESVLGVTFNFLLINRYANGMQYMGEHRDDEKELESDAPIASVSFGQERDFTFRHKDCRGKQKKRSDVPKITHSLQHGSLLVMNAPTNKFWYHALPKRSHTKNPRINLTFRVMKE
uniref:DNA oxidative demethylase ALKBH2 n=1 Tax=Phallusia mammillata TaxID=59560 RepID=A0A6F9D634_9ASCI|nr:alpha-ketoglutarate-dependent dioxygenase alkB homolog 3 [Phallusia mammillata]